MAKRRSGGGDRRRGREKKRPRGAGRRKGRALPQTEPVGYLDRKVRLVPDLREVWSYINPFMLFGRHLGYRGNFEQQLAAREPKAVELFAAMEEVKEEAAKFMKVRAVWQFFEAEAEGEQLHLFAPGENRPAHTWKFK